MGKRLSIRMAATTLICARGGSFESFPAGGCWIDIDDYRLVFLKNISDVKRKASLLVSSNDTPEVEERPKHGLSWNPKWLFISFLKTTDFKSELLDFF